MTLWGNFFKPEKNLELFRLKNCPIDVYPGRLERLAVNNFNKFIFGIILAGPIIVIVSWGIEK